MKKSLWILFLLTIPALTASAQQKEKKKNVPDEEIKVQREFDDKGNLIRYDSLRVFRWSTDSLFQFQPGKGWESFLGKNFLDQFLDQPFFNDSALSFPGNKFPFRFFDEEELFRHFREFEADTSFFRDYLFHNDTSFFMGPDSSFVLPPGFFFPGFKGFDESWEFPGFLFEDPYPGNLPDFGGSDQPFRRFTDPEQQKEWEMLIEKQQQEMKEFRKRWENKKNHRLEKM